MMQTITFTCETITPMFLAGADGTTPELRAPSIKGALRFWWRAMNGHLSLAELQKKETEIFGGSYKNEEGKEVALRSKVIIQIQQIVFKPIFSELVPHKPFMKQNAIPRHTKFEVILRLTKNKDLNIEQLESLFILTTLLGGFGKRARRGMGSVIISKIKKDGKDVPVFDMPSKLDAILEKINLLNTNFQKSHDKYGFECIVPKTSKNQAYPYIKQIHLGRPQSGLELKISKATHETSQEAGRDYGNAMGKIMGGRFASPIYTSIMQNKQKQTFPIIVTLNTVPDNKGSHFDPNVQEDFKSKIL